jgi:hypothetical protein
VFFRRTPWHPAGKDTDCLQEKESSMPLPLFLTMLALVIGTAGATLALAFWAKVPLVALGFAALAGSLLLGMRQWR